MSRPTQEMIRTFAERLRRAAETEVALVLARELPRPDTTLVEVIAVIRLIFDIRPLPRLPMP